MKRYLFTYCLALFLAQGWAQDSTYQYAVVNANMNVVYRGVKNPMSITASPYTCEELFVEAEHGTIEVYAPCHYQYTPIGTATETKINILTITEGDTLLVGSSTFRVKRVPDPVVYYVGLTYEDDTISISAARNGVGLAANLRDADFYVHFMVLSYDLQIDYVDGSSITYTNPSSDYGRLTDEMEVALRDVAPGDNIIFTNIYVRCTDMEIRTLPDLEFVVE